MRESGATMRRAELVRCELDALRDGIVRAIEIGDECVLSRRRWCPSFDKARRVVCIKQTVLHRLCEHATGTPAPHFATTVIKHRKIVRASVGEGEFHPLAAVI